MSEITARMVRELRERSGAGMMECKRALEAAGGDLEAAFDELRKAGVKTAAKKAGRATGEGRVQALVADGGRSGAMVAIACETDFVAKTPDFEAFLGTLCEHVLEHTPSDLETLLAQPWRGDGTVEEALGQLVGKLGENIQITRVQAYQNPEGFVGTYVHHDQKKGALVSVTTGASAGQAQETLKALCMHVVVYSPEALDREAIGAERVERERNIFKEGLAGKPDEIQEKIITGRMEKFYAESVVTEQPWIHDDKTTVAKALEGALGEGTRLAAFTRFQVGG